MTLNQEALLATPLTVTTTFPAVALDGTVVAILVALQLVGAAIVPLKVTVLVPCVSPKFMPVMVTGVATAPLVGLRLVMLGPNGVVTLATLEYALKLPAASTARSLKE